MFDSYWMWAILAVVSGAMLVGPFIQRRMLGIKEVDTLTATQLMNHKDALVLDVREDSEIGQGRIPGARHIPVGKLADRVGELAKYKGKPIVVACRSGNRSASACATLKKQGFGDVYNLKGGVIAWEQAGLPLEKK